MEPAGYPWLTPVILTTQEAETRRIEVQSQAGRIVLKTLSRNTQNRTGDMA
jgi:urease accessory protein UreE